MSRLDKLFTFVELFKRDPLWITMAKTKEDSPWHREDSVAVHTEMVCDEFVKRVSDKHGGFVIDNYTFVITYLSLLFHDTGKPPCKVVKFKPERGHYNAFHGHEIRSARIWESYYVSNYKLFRDWLSVEEAYKVMWMIENHLPYDYMGSDKKMDYLRTAMAGNLQSAWEGFGYHLLGDTYGRISDDMEAKRAKTETFVTLMNSANVLEPRFVETNAPVLNLLIGASGSGKSTHVAELVKQGFVHYSFDDIRIELAKAKAPELMAKVKNPAHEYSTAWGYCDKHRSEFGHFADVRFITHLKDYASVAVDNTNTSRKTRTKFVQEAKKRGYKVVATVFPVDLETIIARQASRGDKVVPEDAVIRQYHGVSLPWVGVEVDELIINTGNLDKK